MINLFIDTNIFLSFFHLTSEDLEELKKLAVLIDNNRDSTLPPGIKSKMNLLAIEVRKLWTQCAKLQDAKFNLSFPLFAKDYQEYVDLRDSMKKADALHAELVKNIMSDGLHPVPKTPSLV